MNDRHAFRAQWHDYNGGIYFVTICSHEKRHIFGKIVSNVGTRFIASASDEIASAPVENSSEPIFIPSELGEIVCQHINNIPRHYTNVEIWNHVVMPNHIHMVLAVGTRFIASGSANASANFGCLKAPKHGDTCEDNHHNSRLATIIGTFKAGVTRTARMTARTRLIASLPIDKIWQSRFHEHIIRNQRAFDNIMYYIDNNIVNWNKDCFYEECHKIN